MFAFVLIGLLACGRNSKTPYPLKSGANWKYQLVAQGTGAGHRAQATLTNLNQRELQGRQVTQEELELTEQAGGRKTKKSWQFFVAEDADGLYAFRDDHGPQTPYYLLKMPVAIGDHWVTTARISYQPVTISSTVESVNEVVTVPAGTFKGCVNIRVSAAPNVIPSPSGLSLDGHMWFAPGIGLVKASYQTSTKVKKDDEVVIQLESYQN